ncbi:hypothetical protein HQ544_05130, partial [Candidatus Falkowbacteria bacterium]|nr:hypothetical protein [Candidatus Falkowbacteria bacterium]
ILGLLTFFSINYISYRTTHITLDEFEEVQVVYSFSKPKDHVSISELTSFTEYMNMINSSSKHQFRYRGAVKLGDEFEVGKAVTTIMFYVQILGALVGSLALALIFADSKYCDKCKKYYKNKTLKSISLEGFENTVKEINENLKDGNKIKSTIENAKEKEGKKSKYIDIALSYCPNCYDGSLIFKFFAVNSKGEPSEVSDMRKEVSINQGVIMELVKK